MEYTDFINIWTGRRMTLADFCDQHAQWERDNLPIDPDPDPSDTWPVLKKDNGTMAILHSEGVLYVPTDGHGHWDHDPDLEALLDEFNAA